MERQTTILSDNLSLIAEVWDNMHHWMDDATKRDAAIQMLNEFDSMVGNKYWLTDAEELFLDQVAHTIESYC